MLCDGHGATQPLGHDRALGKSEGAAARQLGGVSRQSSTDVMARVFCAGRAESSMNPLIPPVSHYRGASRLHSSILAPLRHTPCLLKLPKVHESARRLFCWCLHMVCLYVLYRQSRLTRHPGDRHRNDLMSSTHVSGSHSPCWVAVRWRQANQEQDLSHASLGDGLLSSLVSDMCVSRTRPTS